MIVCTMLSDARPLAAQAGGNNTLALVDSIVRATLDGHAIPGLSLVVMHGGATVIAKGYGVADRATGTPAAAATVYQIGSISKQFTAAAVMRLVERGSLGLDDPVSRHLPEYRPRGDSVRLHHLLRQTSGIREEFTLPAYGARIADTTRPNAELLAMIEGEPFGFAPGTRWSYSNSNYALLAAVIERRTGKPYERVLAEEFFGPQSLSSLHHCAHVPTESHHARGYGLEQGTLVAAPPENMQWIRGDGGLCGSAEDLARWARALATGAAVTPASYRRMTAADPLADGTTPDYGYGLSLLPLDGTHRKISHGGRMAGFTGVLAHYPDHDLTIAMLANRGGLWLEAAEQAVARTVLGLPRPAQATAQLAQRERRQFAGAYDVGVPGFIVRVSERADGLWLEWPQPGPTSKLRYLGARAFAADLEPDALGVTFAAPDRTGRAPRAVLRMAGMHWYGRRIDDGPR